MTNKQLIKIIGREILNRIVTGRYGDASLHSKGYVVVDPCYLFGNEDKRFSQAACEQEPDAYNGKVREWVEIEFEGQRAFFKTCSDGLGPFGHCVDSGWVCALPAAVIPEAIRVMFYYPQRAMLEMGAL